MRAEAKRLRRVYGLRRNGLKGSACRLVARALRRFDAHRGPTLQTFRAYLLDRHGKIVWGDWIEAATEADAVAKAHALCKDGTPMVELWKGDRHLADIPCASGPTAEAAG